MLAEHLGQTELLRLLKEADALHSLRIKVEFEQYRLQLFDPAMAKASISENLRKQEQTIEEEISVEAVDLLDSFYVEDLDDDDPDKIKTVKYQGLILEIEKQDELTKKLNAEFLAHLGKQVCGKVCLIGSAATGAADFVPTPMSKRMSGVEVHSNIVNTITSGEFVIPATKPVSLAMFILAGAAITLISANMRIQLLWPVVLFLILVYVFVNAMAFYLWNIHMPTVGPLTAAGLSFVVVTTCRLLTEERAKRRIRGMFAKSLSPDLVDRLVTDPSMFRLGGERRVLTSLFSDLEGFTTFSEKLGEQKTVQLLNRYFDRMTEVLQNLRGGYISKFLGDGIFAFFGAPVAFEDHSTRAVCAAVECLEQVDLLNEVLATEMDIESALRCRVGIATGDVMVGNCGSSERFDYTAIGDTVNLAARLEAANKFFRTGILLADGTYNLCEKELFIARPFGKIRVVGKAGAVAVWNVLALAEKANDVTKQICERFTNAIRLYEDRKFADAAKIFDGLLRISPSDRPASIFATICDNYATNPPDDQWQGVLELTEKFK